MQGYFIKIGDKSVGPFFTKQAAQAEAKALRDKGYEVSLIGRQVSESQMFEALGNPESEVELDDDIDWDAIFDEGEEEEEGVEEEGEEGEEEEGEEEEEPKPKPDDAPSGKHPWWGNKASA